MRASLVAIGSELLRPGCRETHSEWLLPRLEAAGFEVVSRQVVGDDVASIASAIMHARAGAPLVIVTGGIGPTRDDRTRWALARALRTSLRRHPEAETMVRDWCRRYRFPWTRAQRSQALLPRGSRPLRNRLGSAPGIWLADAGGRVIVLPGVFLEMAAMFSALTPRLQRLAGVPAASATLRTAGVGESRIDARLVGSSRRFPGVDVTTLAAPGEVTIQILARGPGAARRVTSCRRWMARRLGEDLVSDCGRTLEEEVVRLLGERGWRLATAESCTAGMVSSRLTRVPGASAVFLAGAVCYNDRAKREMLSVPSAMLRRHGAVSRAVALAMARGAIDTLGADLAVSVTGIAGPGGGSADKPVGTVHLAVVHPAGATARRWRLAGGREKVRSHAACLALDQIRRVLLRGRRLARS